MRKPFSLKNFLGYIRKVTQSWKDWSGDAEMENQIRSKIRSDGYPATRAIIKNVRLCAIQRPGWVQVFEFEALIPPSSQINSEINTGIKSRNSPEIKSEIPNKMQDANRNELANPPEDFRLFGIIRVDSRSKTKVLLFQNINLRTKQFKIWSEGLIVRRR